MKKYFIVAHNYWRTLRCCVVVGRCLCKLWFLFPRINLMAECLAGNDSIAAQNSLTFEIPLFRVCVSCHPIITSNSGWADETDTLVRGKSHSMLRCQPLILRCNQIHPSTENVFLGNIIRYPVIIVPSWNGPLFIACLVSGQQSMVGDKRGIRYVSHLETTTVVEL